MTIIVLVLILVLIFVSTDFIKDFEEIRDKKEKIHKEFIDYIIKIHSEQESDTVEIPCKYHGEIGKVIRLSFIKGDCYIGIETPSRGFSVESFKWVDRNTAKVYKIAKDIEFL